MVLYVLADQMLYRSLYFIAFFLYIVYKDTNFVSDYEQFVHAILHCFPFFFLLKAHCFPFSKLLYLGTAVQNSEGHCVYDFQLSDHLYLFRLILSWEYSPGLSINRSINFQCLMQSYFVIWPIYFQCCCWLTNQESMLYQSLTKTQQSCSIAIFLPSERSYFNI